MELRKFIESMKNAGLKTEKIRGLALEQFSDAKAVDVCIRELFPDFVIRAEEEKPAEDKPAEDKPAEEKTDAEKSTPKDDARAIVEICAVAGMPERAVDYVRSGKTLENIRKEIITMQSEKTRSAFSGVKVGSTKEIDEKRELLSDAIALRAGFPRKDIAKATEIEKAGFRGLSLMDIARETLEGRGESTRMMNQERIAERALGAGTGDFPYILANVANKFMAKGYLEAQTTYQMWCGIGALGDFKTASIMQLSGFSNLPEVPEGSPMKQLSMSEVREQASLKTYGGYFTISRQALINDDLDTFSRVPFALAGATRRKINALAYGILNTNANLSDGYALFQTANHANLQGTGAVITNTSIAQLVAYLGLQTDAKGNKLNIRGKNFLVPKTKEAIAMQYLNANLPMVVDTSANGSVYRGQFNIVSDAELDGGSTTAYYLTADPSVVDTVTVFFLNGQDMPTMREAESVVGAPQGRTWEVFIDVVAKAIDYRGMAKNLGA